MVYTKEMAEQIIDDIQNNEWYCKQYGSESNLSTLEKIIIIAGLKGLIMTMEKEVQE